MKKNVIHQFMFAHHVLCLKFIFFTASVCKTSSVKRKAPTNLCVIPLGFEPMTRDSLRFTVDGVTVYNIQPLPSLSKRKGLTNLLEFLAVILSALSTILLISSIGYFYTFNWLQESCGINI